MKEVRITLSDDQMAAIDAVIAVGDARSLEELIDMALDAYLTPQDWPSREQMLADIAEVDAELAAGGKVYTADEVMQSVRKAIED